MTKYYVDTMVPNNNGAIPKFHFKAAQNAKATLQHAQDSSVAAGRFLEELKELEDT